MSSKSSGIIVRFSDGLTAVVKHDQPLRVTRSWIILHLVDENYDYILNEEGKPRIRILEEMEYMNEMQASQFIGFVD